jgi:hypothetical protein
MVTSISEVEVQLKAFLTFSPGAEESWQPPLHEKALAAGGATVPIWTFFENKSLASAMN